MGVSGGTLSRCHNKIVMNHEFERSRLNKQRQFINAQYRDTSKVESMVYIWYIYGIYIYIYIYIPFYPALGDIYVI